MAKLEWNLQEIIINNQSFYDEINEVMNKIIAGLEKDIKAELR